MSRVPGGVRRAIIPAAGLGTRLRPLSLAVPPEIFPYLTARYRNPASGEVDLWETFRRLPDGIDHRAVLLPGRPVDLGTLGGYRRYLPRLLRAQGAAAFARRQGETSDRAKV